MQTLPVFFLIYQVSIALLVTMQASMNREKDSSCSLCQYISNFYYGIFKAWNVKKRTYFHIFHIFLTNLRNDLVDALIRKIKVNLFLHIFMHANGLFWVPGWPTVFQTVGCTKLGSILVSKTIMRERLRWLGHILRMKDEWLPKVVLFGQPSWAKRKASRQQVDGEDVWGKSKLSGRV